MQCLFVDCVICNAMLMDGCSLHMDGIQHIADTQITTRARMTIPAQFSLKPVTNQQADPAPCSLGKYQQYYQPLVLNIQYIHVCCIKHTVHTCVGF